MSTSISIGLVPFRAAKQTFRSCWRGPTLACFTAKRTGRQPGSSSPPWATPATTRKSTRHYLGNALGHAPQHGTLLLSEHCVTIHKHARTALRGADPHARCQTNTLLMPGSFIRRPNVSNLERPPRPPTTVEHTLNWLESHPIDAADVDACCINLSAAR